MCLHQVFQSLKYKKVERIKMKHETANKQNIIIRVQGTLCQFKYLSADIHLLHPFLSNIR